MRLNRQLQYAFLLCFYLTRSGRARLEDVAANLSISRTFLEQVARKLRVAKVVKAVRGPGGGYQLIGEPTAKEVMNAFGAKLLHNAESSAYKRGGSEMRAFAHFVENLSQSMNLVLNRKIKNLNQELVAGELKVFNRPVNKALYQ